MPNARSLEPGRRHLASRVLVLSLLPLLIRETIQRNRVTILVYHNPSAATMAEHLRFLSTRYNIISLRRFVEATRRNNLGPLPRKSLVITFDDGYRANRDLTDVFRRLEIPATMFVCSGIIGTARRLLVQTRERPGLDARSR